MNCQCLHFMYRSSIVQSVSDSRLSERVNPHSAAIDSLYDVARRSAMALHHIEYVLAIERPSRKTFAVLLERPEEGAFSVFLNTGRFNVGKSAIYALSKILRLFFFPFSVTRKYLSVSLR